MARVHDFGLTPKVANSQLAEILGLLPDSGTDPGGGNHGHRAGGLLQESALGANEKGQYYKVHSVDQFVRRTRQVLRWGAEQGFLSQDPTVGLLLPRRPAAVPELLTKRQLRTLLRAPDCRTPLGLRDALLLQLLTETPLGLQQVLALTEDTIRQLELEATTWTLLAAYLERAQPVLLRFGSQCEEKTLFLTRDGKPMPLATAAARLNEIMKQVGFGKRLPSRLLHKSHQATLQPLRERHSLLRQEGTNRGDTC